MTTIDDSDGLGLGSFVHEMLDHYKDNLLPDQVPMLDPKTGQQRHVKTKAEVQQYLDMGWIAIETRPDGFRKRGKRTKADMKRLIKDGIVADPEKGVPERVPSENEHVVDVPTAKVTAEKE